MIPLDRANEVLIVTGKGGSKRALPYGTTAREALRRYLRRSVRDDWNR